VGVDPGGSAEGVGVCLSKNEPVGVSPRGLRIRASYGHWDWVCDAPYIGCRWKGPSGHVTVEFTLHSGTGHSGDAEHKHQHQHKTSGSGRRRRRRRRERKKNAD
jgi:hypothetical protein